MASNGKEPASEGTASQGGATARTVYGARWGRGRLGGTGLLLQLAQRAMASGREIRLLDGDLKSQTLSTYYPPPRRPDGTVDEGTPRLCTSPASETPAVFRAWAMNDLTALAEDRVSRLLDVSGGDSVMQEMMQDLELPEFCRDEGIIFTWLCVLGPDAEDFRHIRRAVDAGQLAPRDMLVVFNEGAIRAGQNPAGAFDAIMGSTDYEAMQKAGARSVYIKRLPCMDVLRGAGLDFYAVAAGGPGPSGKRDAVLTHITKRWLAVVEEQYVRAGIVNRLP